MDAFERGARHQRAAAGHAEHGSALDHQEWAQPLAAAEAGIAHRVDQPLRTGDLVGQGRIGQELAEQRFGLLRGLVQALGEVGGRRGHLRRAPRAKFAGQSLMAATSSIAGTVVAFGRNGGKKQET
ncbi:hypothetical protein ACVILH_001795 [Bradyrhizobium sp. USDA 4353]